MISELDPNEFQETGLAVVQACKEVATPGERAQILGEAGLLGVLAPEETGGLGLPVDFALPLSAAAGEGLLGFALIETLLLARAISSVDQSIASSIAAGSTLVSIAWTGTVENGVAGCAPMGEHVSHVLLFCEDGGAVLASVGNAVQAEADSGPDIDTPQTRIRISGPIEGLELGSDVIRTLRSDALLLRSALIIGSSRRCLKLASDYAQERSQFGKLLSSNQAIRHRLARDLLSVETMQNSLARALSIECEDPTLARDTAWLAAAKFGPMIAESAIQVFGGMGFTWDVPLHRHLRQMRAQAAYGSASECLDLLGSAVISANANEWYGDIVREA